MKVISGGQTGVDQMALRTAKAYGIPTGGWMPKGWLTEEGSKPEFEQEYGMQEHSSASYVPRTKQNILDSDVTLIYGDTTSPGSKLAISTCIQNNKPYYLNPTAGDIHKLIDDGVEVFNVAGNRGSKLTFAQISNISGALTRGLYPGRTKQIKIEL